MNRGTTTPSIPASTTLTKQLLLALLLTLLLPQQSHSETQRSPKKSSSSSSATNTHRGVVTLNARNFDSSLRDGNTWLVEFYAPWCSHCTVFAPTYEKIAHAFHTSHKKNVDNDGDGGRKVMVGKVDGSKERALASRFSIRGFPTFFLVDGWTVRQYEGSRSYDAVVKFANETYVDVEPIPFLSSPFGPVGQSRALLMYAGTRLIDLHEALVEKGVSNVVAAGILAFGGIISSLTFIIIIGLMLVPKAKTD